MIENDNNSKDFTYKDDKGKVKLDNYYFKLFIEQELKICKNKPNKNSTFNLVKKEGIFLQIVDTFDIKDSVLDYVKSELDRSVFNLMTSNTLYFKRDYLSMLDTVEFNILKDTKDTSYIMYKNCVVEVTKKGINTKNYKDLGLYVWKDQIIDRNFKICDHHPSEFREFIWLISGGGNLPDPINPEYNSKYKQTQKRYNSFKSAIGYLLHSHNTRPESKAIILNDEIISDAPNGQTGKGLLCMGVSQMKKTTSLDGKDFDFTGDFKYSLVKSDCQVLVYDDVLKGFKFERLFSTITEGISITYKGVDTIKLSISESPKIVITTNYPIKGNSSSFTARMFELELKNYFDDKNRPQDHFGHYFFDDWDEMEWARFDSFMLQCLKFYLENGLVDYDKVNLPFKKMKEEIGVEAFEFISNLEHGQWFEVGLNYNNYVNSISRRNLAKSKNKLTTDIKSYCSFYGLEYESLRSNGVTKFCIRKQIKKDEPKDIWDELNAKSNVN